MQVGDHLDPAELVGKRWFAAPEKSIRSIVVDEHFDFAGGAVLAILRVDVEGGTHLWRSMPIESPDGREPWLGLHEMATNGGTLLGATDSQLSGPTSPHPRRTEGRDVRSLGRDQSHTSVVIDDAEVLKLYRALRPGINPEVEVGRALAADPDAPVPRYRGAVLLQLHMGQPGFGSHEHIPIAFLQDYVADAGDAFEDNADRLAAWLRAGAPNRAFGALVGPAEPAGRATARLHASLARLRGRAYAPRPARPEDIGRWRQRAAKTHRTAAQVLRTADPARAAWLLTRKDAIDRALQPLAAPVPLPAPAPLLADLAPRRLQRIHADLHLGQLLRNGDQFLISDLEGEPQRSVGERRRLDTPLRDLASMLRSFDHVARSGMRRSGVPLEEIVAGTSAADPAIEAWLGAVREAFLEAYADEAAARELKFDLDSRLLHALEVEKELYEFGYAGTYLPAWMYAPSAGMRWLLDR